MRCFRSLILLCCLSASAVAGPMLNLSSLAPPVNVTFSSATATFTQGSFNIADTFNGVTNDNKGWAISPSSASETAYYTIASPVNHAVGGQWTFLMQHQHAAVDHILGHFRLSVTSDPTVNAGSAWTVLTPTSVARTSGGLSTINPGVGPFNSILLTDNNTNFDNLTVLATSSFAPAGDYTGIRLEAIDMPGNLLPTNGPGTAPNANFVLSEFTVSFEAAIAPLTPEPASWALMGSALFGLVGFNYWRRRRQS